MKVGMIVHDMAVSGGFQKLVLRLSEQLESRGCDVSIYTAKLDRNECYPDIINNFKIVSYDGHQQKSFFSRLRYGSYSKIVMEYKNLANKMDRDLDVLILHDEVSLFVLRYFMPSSKGPRVIWMLNNQLSPNLGNSKLNIRVHIRKNMVKGLIGISKEFASGRINSIYGAALAEVDHFAVYDNHNKQLVKKFLGREADLVYAGADLSKFKQVKPVSHKGFNVLSVGVVFPHRRYEDLISATKTLADKGLPVHLTIVGRRDLDKGYSQKLAQLVERLNLAGKTDFIDYLSDNDLLKQYALADAFAFINDAETWGIAVFEAIAAGIPTLITSNIGASDLLKDKKDAWVVPPRSPQKVADALLEIYSDPKTAKKITATSSAKIQNIVSWTAYADRMLNLMVSDKEKGSAIDEKNIIMAG